MVALSSLLDPDRLTALVEDGFIACKRHLSEPLRLYDYTPRAQYERCWTAETLACRGLIVADDDTVVARPFAKFFNADEHEQTIGPLPWHEPFEVFDKLDGSLGILYTEPVSGRVAVSTRGSFTSDQAVRATALLRSRYPSVTLPADQTWLAEIIYPDNRIVVDYRGLDDLVFLAALDHSTGSDLPVPAKWPGPRVSRHPGFSSRAALLAAGEGRSGDDGEGFVVRFASGLRVKVKFEDYVRLHRLVTGVSTKTVWEFLSEGRPFDELLDRVPDEFHRWLTDTVASLQGRFEAILTECQATMADPRVDRSDRRATAAFFQTRPNTAVLFKLLDGRDPSPLIWRHLKPAFAKPFRTDTEG